MKGQRFFPFILLLLICGLANAQSTAVDTFTSDRQDFRKFYIYQSVMRIANIQKDANFNKLIKHVRKLDVYVSRKDSLQDQNVLAGLHKDLRDEGYERLIEADVSDGKLILHSRSASNRDYFLVTLREKQGRLVILEVDGTFDLKYLLTLQEMDFGVLRDLVLENGGIDFD